MSTSLTTTSAQPTDHTTRTPEGVIIGPIPLLLYEEISRDYGWGEELTGPNYGNGFWRRRALDADNASVGFAGTIGVRKQFEDFYFTLWSRTFEGITSGEELDYYARKSEVLVISSGIRHTGMWAYGKGNHMTESHTFSLRTQDIRLVDRAVVRAVQFAAGAIEWASQMALETHRYSESFWEADRDPSGNYEEPDS